MKGLKNYIFGAAAVIYAVFLVMFVKDIGEAVGNSVKVCLEVMIPSLYAFMVISGFIVSSNLYAVLGKPFGIISRYVFRIPTEYFSVFLISSIGGYPVGAKLLANMCRENKIDRETAENMLSYCYLAGPAFICSIAGVKLFSSVKTGMLIFASVLGANIIIGVLKSFSRKVPPKSQSAVKLNLSMECLIDSVYSGAKGMLSICAIIVFFSTIICILNKLNIIQSAAGLLTKFTYLEYSDSLASIKAFIEISGISLLTAGNYRLVPVAAALLSFGGMCVIIQIKGFVSGVLSTKYFYFSRILSSVISYFLCKILITVFDAEPVYTLAVENVAYRHNSPIPSIFLLIMTILLLLNISMAKRQNL